MRKQSLKDIKRFRNRHMIVSVLIMSVISLIIVALFRFMYSSAKMNILNAWENNVIQLAKSTEYYLARPTDAIEYSAAHVEEMMAAGKTNQEIGEHLIKEKHIVAALVKNNSTGVYAYCRGEYLDASGWVPDKDYKPTERPWYIAAKENNGLVTLVSPYPNLQTHEMMLSLSKLLNDGESVISMDIFIDGLQRTFDDLAKKEGVKAALIMDVLGNVVVHSKHDEIAKNYLMDGSEYRKKLAERVRNIAGRADYYDTEPSDGEILFAEKVNNNWCAVVILDEANLLGYLRYMNIILILFLALVFLAWYGIAKTIDRKYREAEADALSNLYNRRSGEERIRKLLASGTKGVFILLDIDKFKLINDRFGHDVGDLVIAAVADSLRKTFRDSDVVFRLGGDGIAVFASGIHQEESKERLIQRLHAEISRINIPELRGHPVTVSAGTGDYGGETEDTYETLYQRADKNMYESKRKKRKE